MLNLLQKLFSDEAFASLLCVLNAGVLLLIAVPYAREAFRRGIGNIFLLPTAATGAEGTLDLRREMQVTATGLFLFVGLYLSRAPAPHEPSRVLCPWSILVDLLMAGGLLRASGRADARGVRISRRLPRAQEPRADTRRVFVAARHALRSLYKHERTLQFIAFLTLIAGVVVAMVADPKGWPDVLDGTVSVSCFSVVALVMGVELTRTEPDPFSLLVASAWAFYAVVQCMSVVSGALGVLGRSSSLLDAWYWIVILAALLTKTVALLGFAGLYGLVRIYTPALEHQIATEGMVAAGRLGNVLSHQTSHVLGRLKLKLGQVSRAVSNVEGVPARVQERIAEMVSDLDLLTLALDAYRALRGDVRERARSNLGEVIGDLCRVLQRDWTDVRIVVRSAPALHARISRAALVNVIFNLIDNARNAIRSAQRTAPGTITVVVEGRGDLARILVSNDGPPIDARRRDALFVYPMPGQDWGMGLWACRMLVEERGGALLLLDDDKETTFAVDLPVAREELDSEDGARSDRSAVGEAPHDG